MTYSLCFSLVNARHFKTPIDIWGNFVPGMVFFQSIFGYLVFCILYKWSIDWNHLPPGSNGPPSLLNLLIYMFLQPGQVAKGDELYHGQATVQTLLLLMAVICVPILLLLKPLYLRWEHNRARALGYRGIGETSRFSALDDNDEDGHVMNGNRDSMGSDREATAMITQDIGEEGHEEFEFSEVMIHQTIHTIGKNLLPHPIATMVLTTARILPQLRLTHSLVSPSLGPLARPPTALRCALDHDPWQRFRVPGRFRCHHGCCILLPLVLPYYCYIMCHGGDQRHVTFVEVALG